MTVKTVRVQVSPREDGREVFLVTIPAKFSRTFLLKKGQVLKATAVIRRTGEFRITYRGMIENDRTP